MPGADAIAGDSSRPRAAATPLRHAGLIVTVVLLVYANALPNAFLWDDLYLVVGNPAIKSLANVPRAFASDLFPAGIQSGYYRPLQTLSYAIDYALWGLAPAAFHLTNVLLHAATAVLLWRVGARVLGSAPAALAGALLFAVHPVHVEAVTYVAGRSDPLAAVLMLVAVLGFLRGDGRGRTPSLAAFFLALLAREAALVLPLLLVVLDRIVPGRRPRSAASYLPYGAVLAIYLGFRALSVEPGSAAVATAAVPLGFRLLTMAEVIVRYLAIVVVPLGLHMERAVAPVASLLDPVALAAVAALAVAIVGALRAPARAWPLTLGVAWFLVALLPVANVVPLATFMAEHWLYVPLMGLCLGAGWGVQQLAREDRRRPVLIAFALVVAVYGGLTMRRNLEWRDGRTLYEHLLPLAPESLRIRVNLAQAYQEAGELEGARAAYEEVIRRRPDHPDTADALNNLGNIHREAGRLDAALAAFERALVLEPRHVAARNGRALTLQGLGRVAAAERELEAALAIDPDSATTHSNLGNLYFRRDELARARDRYLAAVRLDPDHADAHNNLGSVYFRLGERDLAEAEYRRALALDPGSEAVRRNLGIVHRNGAEPPGH
jgi:Flp pilus assembly protein TadD